VAGALAVLTDSVATGLTVAVVAVVVALVLFGTGTAARLLSEREKERQELKQHVVAEERKRFSRDMHDLLGLSLSAITLKGELVDRLLITRPQVAKEELAELLVMSRRALADVRAIAAGYRELSLDDEYRAVADVLSAAGIRVTAARSGTSELPPDVAGTLAAVLREGVMNVVRHSSATWCAFSVSTADGTAWLEIVNDGVRTCERLDADSGFGLRNLRRRVEALGGALVAEVQPDGTHRLAAAIPV
jgi:two-component system sensor histidine kinase DesK